jgi:uncharacterized cupredoxin-like copper-binding protein
MKHQIRSITVFVLAVVALSLSACGGTAAAQPKVPEIVIKAQDFRYEAPKQVDAGLVVVTLENAGKGPHQAQLVRLNDGVTMDRLTAALKQGPEKALPLVELAGGPNTIDPDQRQQVTLDLKPGQYVIMSFVSGSDNVPDMAKGMLAPLEAVASNQAQAVEPRSDGEATLQDFMITPPANVKAGQQVWKVKNHGPQPHELVLMKLDDGKTMDDVMKFMQAPSGKPPFSSAGGLAALAPRTSAWVSLNLQPGYYLALCFVPDPATGKAHAEMGMMQVFTVK